MKKSTSILFKNTILVTLLILSFTNNFAQGNAKPSCEFWRKVQYGGGVGLNIGNGFTDISLAPSAIYNVNEIFSVGVGLQGSYVSSNNAFSSYTYGASLFGLANVSNEIQLSLDLDQMKVNTSYPSSLKLPSNRFWNTALFLGAGFRSDNITIGVKYNVLFKQNDQVYNEAFLPFVRVFF